MEITDITPADATLHDKERGHQVLAGETMKTEKVDGLSEGLSLNYDSHKKATIKTLTSEATQCLDLSTIASHKEHLSDENENQKEGGNLHENSSRNLESQNRSVTRMEHQDTILSSEVVLVSELSRPVGINADRHVSETMLGDQMINSTQESTEPMTVIASEDAIGQSEQNIVTQIDHKENSNEHESKYYCKKEMTNLVEIISEYEENVIEGQVSSAKSSSFDVDGNENVIYMNDKLPLGEPGYSEHMQATIAEPISDTTDDVESAGQDDIVNMVIMKMMQTNNVIESENDAKLTDNDDEKLTVTLDDVQPSGNDTVENTCSGVMDIKVDNDIEAESCATDHPGTKLLSDGFQIQEHEIYVNNVTIHDESVTTLGDDSAESNEMSNRVTCSGGSKTNVHCDLSEPTSTGVLDSAMPNNMLEIDENDQSTESSALDNISESIQNEQCVSVSVGELDTHNTSNISGIDQNASVGELDGGSQNFWHGNIFQDILKKPEEFQDIPSSLINSGRFISETNESDTLSEDMLLIRESSDEAGRHGNSDNNSTQKTPSNVEVFEQPTVSKSEPDQPLPNTNENNALYQEARVITVDSNELESDTRLLNVEEHQKLCQEFTQSDTAHLQHGVSSSINLKGPSILEENEFRDAENALLNHSDRFVSARMWSDSLDSDIFEDARDSLETCSLFSCNDVSDYQLDNLQSPSASRKVLRSSSTNSSKGSEFGMLRSASTNSSKGSERAVSRSTSRSSRKGADIAILRSTSSNSNKGTNETKTKLEGLLHKTEDPTNPTSDDLKAPAPEAWQEQEFANSPKEEKENEKEAVMLDITAKAKEDKPMKYTVPLKSLLAKDVPATVLEDTKGMPSPRKGGKLKMKFMWLNCICCRDVH